MIEFELAGHDYIELHRLLKVTGLCTSGGMAKLLIAGGKVQVDGEVETRKRRKIRAGQEVDFNDLRVAVR